MKKANLTLTINIYFNLYCNGLLRSDESGLGLEGAPLSLSCCSNFKQFKALLDAHTYDMI